MPLYSHSRPLIFHSLLAFFTATFEQSGHGHGHLAALSKKIQMVGNLVINHCIFVLWKFLIQTSVLEVEQEKIKNFGNVLLFFTIQLQHNKEIWIIWYRYLAPCSYLSLYWRAYCSNLRALTCSLDICSTCTQRTLTIAQSLPLTI